MWHYSIMSDEVDRFITNYLNPLLDCAHDCYGNFCSRLLLRAADIAFSHPLRESNDRKRRA